MILDQFGNPMGPRRGRGFYSMVGDGASKAVQGAYRNVNQGMKEAVGAMGALGSIGSKLATNMNTFQYNKTPFGAGGGTMLTPGGVRVGTFGPNYGIPQ